MSLIVNNTEVTDVVYNGTPLDTVIFNGVTVFEASSPVAMFNFTGIDANGSYEYRPSFNGTIVEYAIGERKAVYLGYTQVTPTPTTPGGYAPYYVRNSSGKYESCSGSLPSYVEVGVTPCYSRSSDSYKTRPLDTETIDYVFDREVYTTNNGFNASYFNGFDFATLYKNINDIPYLDINTIKFPSNYLGKPVTKILRDAFVGVTNDSFNGKYFYAPYRINNCILGKNILEIEFLGLTMVGRANFVINNEIQKLNDNSLGGVFSLKTNVIDLPSSLTYISSSAFEFRVQDSSNPFYPGLSNPPFAVSSETINCGSNITIFRRTVKNLSTTTDDLSGKPLRSIIVFEHTQNDEITLDLSNLKNATEITIYTDCDAVKNYDWASKNYTATFHPLSEYEGD